MTKAQIEKKYGVHIADDSFWNPRTGRYVKAYAIYSADGERWECGLHKMEQVEAECKEWAKALLEIKAAAERRSA